MRLVAPQPFWEYQARGRAGNSIYLVGFGFAGLLAFLHFAFFYYNPSQLANRYFALFTLCAAAASLLHYFSWALAFPTLGPFLAINTLSFAISAVAYLWAIGALYALFGFQRGWFYKGAWIGYGGVVAALWVYQSTIAVVPWAILDLVNVFEQLRLSVRALRQQKRGAGLVAAGYAGGLLAAVGYVVEMYFTKNPSSPWFNTMVVLCFVLPALGISLYLAREFALDAELLVKLGEVECLSAQTLAQAQEKQVLLARQNETLETQVAERTGELQASLAELRASQDRLGELDAAKNQFFANVSHELRTPLTLVLGPLDSLLTAPAPPLPTAVRSPVALAHRSARRLQELVDRILDLTKLQAGRLEWHPVPTVLAALLRRVVTQFESLAAARRVVLVLPPTLPEALRLLLDADKVEQILTNLLINALNHTPAGGAVSVGATLPDATGQYVLTVRDTGPGIAPAEQARVFERFYQSPQRQAQGGTGLGLALSRELATLLGGTLTLASEPGQGAAFTLRFPAPALPAEAAAAPELDQDLLAAGEEEVEDGVDLAPALGPGRRPRVLVVDQADLREYLRQLLSPAYEVLIAADGQDALDVLVREAPIDLVTTDAMMPRLSGTELLAQLKADPARASLPILMLTARADEAFRLASLTLGVDDYLTKPFVPAELLARVATLLRRHAVRRHFASQPPEVLTAEAAAPLAAEPPPAPESPGLATTATADRPAPPLPSAAGGEQLGWWQAQVQPHPADPAFGPTKLADLLCLSERTLYRRLDELAGLTPAAWLRELRLDYARQLLEAGNFRSVADVADAAGFVTAKAFAARYAERFGRRPHTYRP